MSQPLDAFEEALFEQHFARLIQETPKCLWCLGPIGGVSYVLNDTYHFCRFDCALFGRSRIVDAGSPSSIKKV